MTAPLLSQDWFDRLADRLPGADATGTPIAFESRNEAGAPLRHSLVVADGFVQAWHEGWSDDTRSALRLTTEQTLAVCTGAMQVWNGTVPVELLVAGPDEPWAAHPLPPFDVAGLVAADVGPPAGGAPFEWAELLVGSPFGPLDLLWTADDRQIHSVAPRAAEAQPELRMVARYSHYLEARAGRRSWLATYEDGGWIDGPDHVVERLLGLLDRFGADSRYRLDAAIADPLLALSRLVTGAGCAQVQTLLELVPTGAAS